MKKKLEKKINLLLSLIIIVVLLPLLVTIVLQRMQLENLLSENMSGESVLWEDTESGTDLSGGADIGFAETPETAGGAAGAGSDADEQAESAEAEERVVGIVAKEISAGSSREAILAQCVIARTNLYDAWQTGTEEPQSLDIEEMQSLWGEDFQKIYQKLKGYAELTEGQVLMCQGNYIYAAYHAVSAGKTRDISEMYQDVSMPYLKENLCQEDATAEEYLAVLYWEKNDFLEKCRELFPDTVLDGMEQIEIESRDGAGYVLAIKIGSVTYTGEEFRSSFGLNSACFALTQTGEQVRIVTKGLGHGFGLSQYTAELMAEEGKGYQEILEFFYPGTEIKET